jgi:uncharacterized membrane protein YcgQ (UPF0703/DUF1980 family)
MITEGSNENIWLEVKGRLKREYASQISETKNH